jgi:hypothetical protein
MMSVTRLYVDRLNVVMLSAFVLNVEAPNRSCKWYFSCPARFLSTKSFFSDHETKKKNAKNSDLQKFLAAIYECSC